MAQLNSICINGHCGEASEIALMTVGGAMDNITVPAGGRKNVQFELPELPAGYTIGAYRQISIAKGSSVTDANWQTCIIQTFSTAGGGRNVNISIVNFGTEDATCKLSITVMAIG